MKRMVTTNIKVKNPRKKHLRPDNLLVFQVLLFVQSQIHLWMLLSNIFILLLDFTAAASKAAEEIRKYYVVQILRPQSCQDLSNTFKHSELLKSLKNIWLEL